MSINIIGLNDKHLFEDERIRIHYSPGVVSNSLTVDMKDQDGKLHHVLWEVSPDRCHQNFDKVTPKIREFVKTKIQEWRHEEEDLLRLREQLIKEKSLKKESYLKELMDSF